MQVLLVSAIMLRVLNRVPNPFKPILENLADGFQSMKSSCRDLFDSSSPSPAYIMTQDSLTLLHGNALQLRDELDLAEDKDYLRSLLDELNLFDLFSPSVMSKNLRALKEKLVSSFKNTLFRLGQDNGFSLKRYDDFSKFFQETFAELSNVSPDYYQASFDFGVADNFYDINSSAQNDQVQMRVLEELVGEKNLLGVSNSIYRLVLNRLLPTIFLETGSLPANFNFSILVDPKSISSGDEIVFDYHFAADGYSLSDKALRVLNEEIYSNFPFKLGAVLKDTVKALVSGKDEFNPALMNGDIAFKLNIDLNKQMISELRKRAQNNGYSNIDIDPNLN